jgi:hypothetical protein
VSGLGRGKVCFRKTFYFKQGFSKLDKKKHEYSKYKVECRCVFRLHVIFG